MCKSILKQTIKLNSRSTAQATKSEKNVVFKDFPLSTAEAVQSFDKELLQNDKLQEQLVNIIKKLIELKKQILFTIFVTERRIQ